MGRVRTRLPRRWSAGRPHFARAPVCTALETTAFMDLTRHNSRCPLSGRLRRSLRRLPFRATAASTSCAVGRHQGRLRVRSTRVIVGQPFHIVSSVDIGLCYHMVVTASSGSRALCSYTCVQILIGQYDAWSPLGRRACMQFRCLHVTCARLRCARMLSCSVCVLFWSIYACLHAHAASFCPACVFASVHVSIFSMPMTYVVPRHSPQSYSPCPTRSCHTAHVQHACHVCTPMPVL
jgi:hypothetical protein